MYSEIAEQLCHRVGIINRGQIVARGTLAELRSNAQGEYYLPDLFPILRSQGKRVAAYLHEG
jgi:ABC-type multidrug transport system ATPase subunit